ncbi:hypothetical protein D082_24890 [Synechocystis sp. PCC 6714]|nr:hypothetical protein D082_24890 [Synechocystis sp. PCC 6714]
MPHNYQLLCLKVAIALIVESLSKFIKRMGLKACALGRPNKMEWRW